jgi:hypothetical protein
MKSFIFIHLILIAGHGVKTACPGQLELKLDPRPRPSADVYLLLARLIFSLDKFFLSKCHYSPARKMQAPAKELQRASFRSAAKPMQIRSM